MKTREFLHNVMSLAWQLIKRNGMCRSEAMKTAWANLKLKAMMQKRIVKFYFQKVDGSLREAYGTLKSELIPATAGEGRKKDIALREVSEVSTVSFKQLSVIPSSFFFEFSDIGF